MNKNFFKKIFSGGDIELLIAAVILFAVLSIFSDSFLTAYNLLNIGRNLSLVAFIGLSQAVVLV